MEWFLALPLLKQIPIVLGGLVLVADNVCGTLPDKYCKWPGITLALFNRLYEYGKIEKSKLK